MIRLEADEWVCTIAPELGGAILTLSWQGTEVFRPAAKRETHPFRLSSFVMAPYANRISHGRFAWRDTQVELPPNIVGEKHPLHGVAFAAPWRVIEVEDDAVLLAQSNAASPAWPWACELTQRVSVGASGLLHEVELTNADSRAAPCGIGFHPYFAPSSDARLMALVDGVWVADAEQLPVRWQALSDVWAGLALKQDVTIDNCFTGWNSRARIDWPGAARALEVTTSPELDHLHVYVPADGDFFCIEPVSHRPNAINADPEARGAMRVLEAGEKMSAWMRVAVAEDQ